MTQCKPKFVITRIITCSPLISIILDSMTEIRWHPLEGFWIMGFSESAHRDMPDAEKYKFLMSDRYFYKMGIFDMIDNVSKKNGFKNIEDFFEFIIFLWKERPEHACKMYSLDTLSDLFKTFHSLKNQENN